MEKIRTTYSICPKCGKQISAEILIKDDGVCLDKGCPEHGNYSVLIWKNKRDIPLTQEEETKYEKTSIRTTQANDTSNIRKYLKITECRK